MITPKIFKALMLYLEKPLTRIEITKEVMRLTLVYNKIQSVYALQRMQIPEEFK